MTSGALPTSEKIARSSPSIGRARLDTLPCIRSAALFKGATGDANVPSGSTAFHSARSSSFACARPAATASRIDAPMSSGVRGAPSAVFVAPCACVAIAFSCAAASASNSVMRRRNRFDTSAGLPSRCNPSSESSRAAFCSPRRTAKSSGWRVAASRSADSAPISPVNWPSVGLDPGTSSPDP